MDAPEKFRESSSEAGRENSPGPIAVPGVPNVDYPEGGQRAWLAVLGAWCVMVFTFGYLNAFG